MAKVNKTEAGNGPLIKEFLNKIFSKNTALKKGLLVAKSIFYVNFALY